MAFFSFKSRSYWKLFVAGCIHLFMFRANEASALEFFPSLIHNSSVIQSKNIWEVAYIYPTMHTDKKSPTKYTLKILRFEHRKILEACLTIFHHYTQKV